VCLHAEPSYVHHSFSLSLGVCALCGGFCLFLQGILTEMAYREKMAAEIGYAVQDALGLDVLVHGEAERSGEFWRQCMSPHIHPFVSLILIPNPTPVQTWWNTSV